MDPYIKELLKYMHLNQIKLYNIVKENFPCQDRVQIFNFAISGRNETVKFNISWDTLCSSLSDNVSNSHESYLVKCFNLFDFLNFHDISRIDLLKIDCEGAEYEIFNSIPDEYFSQIKKIHVEFHENDGEKIRSLIDKLERNGFKWIFEKDKNYNSDLGLIFARK